MALDLSALTAAVEAETTVVTSAITLLNGLSGNLEAVKAELLAKGITEADLQSLTDVTTSITSTTDALAAAVVANTPAA